MQTRTFTYSEGNQKRMSTIFLVLGIVGTALTLYLWLRADPILLSVLIGGAFLAIVGIIAFLKLFFAPNKENEVALTISDKGITSNTTPVAKAVGLIEWTDVADIQLYTKILEVKIKNPEKYAERIKSFFVRDTFLKSMKGAVRISFMETNATYEELRQVLESNL